MNQAYLLASLSLLAGGAPPPSDPYPVMAPLARYMMASDAEEVALARSAAPPSIADHAEVLVFGKHGYTSAVKGSNGFVCLVVRGWDNNFSSTDFWNPKTRSPICFNAPAARTVLPTYLLRTEWALGRLPKAIMVSRDKAALAGGQIRLPERGSMSYMLAKGGYLGDDANGPWHPHVMFIVPRTAAAEWGANMPGSPVIADDKADDETTVFMVVVRNWSNGVADATEK